MVCLSLTSAVPVLACSSILPCGQPAPVNFQDAVPPVMTPAVASVLGGAGEKSWFGWPTSEPMEKLRAAFVREPDAAKRKQIAEQVQQLNFDEVLFVTWGQFVVPGAFRKNVQGVLQFGATILWNIQV